MEDVQDEEEDLVYQPLYQSPNSFLNQNFPNALEQNASVLAQNLSNPPQTQETQDSQWDHCYHIPTESQIQEDINAATPSLPELDEAASTYIPTIVYIPKSIRSAYSRELSIITDEATSPNS